MAKSDTRLYAIWKGIKRRCNNENYHHYCNYGGRGIKMCPEWLYSFDAFEHWALNNGYEETLTIERLDVNGNYCPENCAWADRMEQNNNTRRNHIIEYQGGLYTIAELSRIAGVKQNTLLYRLKRGWSVDEAVLAINHRKR